MKLVFKMFFNKKPIDFLAIGDITIDAFIRLENASVHCNLDREGCELCVAFGQKIPYRSGKIIYATGNASNAAIAAARLGLSVAIVTNLGDDKNGKDCLTTLNKEKISTDYARVHSGTVTNFNYVLWYEDERTILVRHELYERVLPTWPSGRPIFEKPKWLYLSSIGADSEKYHQEILNYLETNPEVKLAFQPGTFQFTLGLEKLAPFIRRAEVFACNREEAKKLLGLREDGAEAVRQLHNLGAKNVIVTNGASGAYIHDGEDIVFMPTYPNSEPPVERTGAGDAYAATFVAALILGKTPREAALWAPINARSVVQFVGAHEGLLARPALEELLAKAPSNYRLSF
ncbi:MAG: putative Ribokinase [Parcubacteria group bacterium Gr01-1014_73]|nr:MAG: putative Ribokinase [Parcubacteria group bacterium Gr01-1014_73]